MKRPQKFSSRGRARNFYTLFPIPYPTYFNKLPFLRKILFENPYFGSLSRRSAISFVCAVFFTACNAFALFYAKTARFVSNIIAFAKRTTIFTLVRFHLVACRIDNSAFGAFYAVVSRRATDT